MGCEAVLEDWMHCEEALEGWMEGFKIKVQYSAPKLATKSAPGGSNPIQSDSVGAKVGLIGKVVGAANCLCHPLIAARVRFHQARQRAEPLVLGRARERLEDADA